MAFPKEEVPVRVDESIEWVVPVGVANISKWPEDGCSSGDNIDGTGPPSDSECSLPTCFGPCTSSTGVGGVLCGASSLSSLSDRVAITINWMALCVEEPVKPPVYIGST